MIKKEIEAPKDELPSLEKSSRKKVRKRRAINRTGFPTVKKKKKKLFAPEMKHEKAKLTKVCERVPREGEKCSAYMQRMEKVNVSNVLLEKLQKSIGAQSAHSDSEVSVKDSEENLERRLCRSSSNISPAPSETNLTLEVR